MSESNKMVIKINYQGGEEQEQIASEPRLIEEWHIKRIVVVIITLILIALLFVYINDKASNIPEDSMSLVGQTAQREPESKTLASVESTLKENVKEHSAKQKNKGPAGIAAITETKPELVSQVEENKRAVKKIQALASTASNSKISRAIITLGLNKKEPLDSISSFITVNENNARGLYYFTEIMDMKGQHFSHYWLWNQQIVYKKKFVVLGNRWRAATSKLIPYSKAGNWVVRLVDAEGEVLNEISFEVIKE